MADFLKDRSSNGITVVVLEDGEPRMRLLVWGLTTEGFRVYPALDHGQAEAVLKRFASAAVIANGTGPLAARRVGFKRFRTLAPNAMLIDLYGGDEPPDIGADIYIGAPYPLATIVSAIPRIASRLQEAPSDA